MICSQQELEDLKNQLFFLLETEGKVVKTCLMYYTQIISLVRPTWRSLNYRIKAEKLRLFNLTNNYYYLRISNIQILKLKIRDQKNGIH